jgi:hypothetical protein
MFPSMKETECVYKVKRRVRFQVLTAASMKIMAFWDIAPRSLVKLTDVSEVRTAFFIRAMNPALFSKLVVLVGTELGIL